MPSTVEATVRTHLTAVETLTGDFISTDNATFTVNGMDSTQVLTGSTTPPVTKVSAYRLTLSGGTDVIDLTALVNATGDGTITGLGLKVQAVKFRNKSTNANTLSVTEGASNGHPLLGASFLFALLPGQSVTMANEGVDAGTDVAAGDKTWDVVGTAAEVLELEVILG